MVTMFMQFLFVCYIFYCLPIVIIGIPSYFFLRAKTTWTIYDLGLLILPYCAWFLESAFVSDHEKSITNAVVEPLYLGLIVAFIPLIKFILQYFGRNLPAKFYLFSMCVIAILIGFLVPGMPE